MPHHDTPQRLRDMLAHAKEASDLAREKDRTDVTRDRVLELALTRLIEVIGEAASRVPRDEQALYPGIPWMDIISMRNRLIHGYDSVDLDILWNIVTGDLPPLVAELERIVSAPSRDGQ